tara:strand:+ start:162 stop:1442 length:1281 start_codon:yes stop_codon:yes gene_type:complete
MHTIPSLLAAQQERREKELLFKKCPSEKFSMNTKEAEKRAIAEGLCTESACPAIHQRLIKEQLERCVEMTTFSPEIYTGGDIIADALLSHLPVITSQYQKEKGEILRKEHSDRGFMANELILLATADSLKKAESLKNSDGFFCPSFFVLDREPGFEGWGMGDEKIIEYLAIATGMAPEVMDDENYNWERIFEPSYNELEDPHSWNWNYARDDAIDLAIKFCDEIHAQNYPSNEEEEEYFSITSDDIRHGRWVNHFGHEETGTSRDDFEWSECNELSLFKEYDITHHVTGSPPTWIIDHRGNAKVYNAEYHEQQSSLNALFNHPEHDWKTWQGNIEGVNGTCAPRVRPDWNDWHKLDRNGIDMVYCTLKASGENFAVCVSEYGAAYVPKEFLRFIGENIGDTFYAKLKIPRGSRQKYALRVEQILSS